MYDDSCFKYQKIFSDVNSQTLIKKDGGYHVDGKRTKEHTDGMEGKSIKEWAKRQLKIVLD